MISSALAMIKASEEMEKTINKWEAKEKAQQTWTELKSFLQTIS